jgi:hypothetical protein
MKVLIIFSLSVWLLNAFGAVLQTSWVLTLALIICQWRLNGYKKIYYVANIISVVVLRGIWSIRKQVWCWRKSWSCRWNGDHYTQGRWGRCWSGALSWSDRSRAVEDHKRLKFSKVFSATGQVGFGVTRWVAWCKLCQGMWCGWSCSNLEDCDGWSALTGGM